MGQLNILSRLSLRVKKSFIRPQGQPTQFIETSHTSSQKPLCPIGHISGEAEGECVLGGRRIGYAFQVGFEPQTQGSQRHAGLRGWALDLDSFTPIATLMVTSELGVSHRILPTERRPDILNRLSVPQDRRAGAIINGFSDFIPNAGTQITLSLDVNGHHHTVGIGTPKKPQVLAGRQGWLFLTGDSNDSSGQFSGHHKPSQKWLDEWAAYFKALNRLETDTSAGQLCVLIAPSKESLFPDYYPLPKGIKSPLENLLEQHSDVKELYYPVDVLSEFRELSYDKAETHWTDFGARLVCQEIVHRWKRHNPPLPLQFNCSYQSGDLGWKTVPPVKTYRANAAWPNTAKIIFDNFILHHGRIRVWSNPQAPRKQTGVIFGGSSAEHMERYYTALFSRIVYVYSAGSWDPSILNHERPNFTIMQTSERFLTRAPSPEVDTAKVVKDKIAKGHVTNNQPREKILSDWTDPSIVIYKEMG